MLHFCWSLNSLSVSPLCIERVQGDPWPFFRNAQNVLSVILLLAYIIDLQNYAIDYKSEISRVVSQNMKADIINIINNDQSCTE